MAVGIYEWQVPSDKYLIKQSTNVCIYEVNELQVDV